MKFSWRDWILIFLGLICLCIPDRWYELGQIGAVDFQQYWSGANLFLHHGNPYSSDSMRKMQQGLACYTGQPVLLWNPPFIFSLIWPFGFFDFKLAQHLWFWLSVVLVAWAFLKLDQVFCWRQRSSNFIEPQVGSELPESHNTVLKLERIFEILILLSFYPIALALGWGQVTPILLLGLAGFWQAFKNENHFRAGAWLSLTLFKPHLLWLFYLLLILGLPNRKLFHLGLGFLCAGLGLSLFVLVLQPDIWSFYFAALNSPPIEFKTPTFGSLLQAITGQHSVYIRTLPTFVGLGLAIVWGLKNKAALADKPKLIQTLLIFTPLSLLLSPYGWVYDQALLLPTLIWLLSRKLSAKEYTQLLSWLFAGHTLMCTIPARVGQEWFVWYPVLIFFLAIKFGKLGSQSMAPVGECRSSPHAAH